MNPESDSTNHSSVDSRTASELPTDVATVIREALFQIAPDIDYADVDPDADLREEFDIDSMDFLNFVSAVSARLNIPMPESDYGQMLTLKQVQHYLEK